MVFYPAYLRLKTIWTYPAVLKSYLALVLNCDIRGSGS